MTRTQEEKAELDYGNARDSATRKGQPIATGLLAYFPHACAAVAECSRKGNDKHNPGEALHWAKEKSTDEADCVARHLTDALADGPLVLNEDGVPHVVSLAWRALAFAERALTGDDRWKGLPKGYGKTKLREASAALAEAIDRAAPHGSGMVFEPRVGVDGDVTRVQRVDLVAARICTGCGSELTPGASHTHCLP